MFCKEDSNISLNTWARAIEPVNKAGYMDGSSDGQKKSFQSSFDTGYKQGFNFGLQLGLNDASQSNHEHTLRDVELTDARRINCQMCLNITSQDKVDNLFNIQKEKNNIFLKHCIKIL